MYRLISTRITSNSSINPFFFLYFIFAKRIAVAEWFLNYKSSAFSYFFFCCVLFSFFLTNARETTGNPTESDPIVHCFSSIFSFGVSITERHFSLFYLFIPLPYFRRNILFSMKKRNSEAFLSSPSNTQVLSSFIWLTSNDSHRLYLFSVFNRHARFL